MQDVLAQFTTVFAKFLSVGDDLGEGRLTPRGGPHLAAKKMFCADRQVPDLVRPAWVAIEGPVAIDCRLD